MKKTMLLLLSCCIQYICIAQSNSLTLEDIYTKNKYAAKGFGPLVFMKDNKGYTTLEYNASFKSNEIILYDIISGSKKILVSAKQLIPNGLVNPLSIYNYTWSNDNKNLLIYTNTKKVWRQNTKGDYWVLNIASGMLSQIGKTLPSASLMFAKFSPNGKEIAYVSNLNIYKENLATHAITQISFDGGGDIINGTFDWVYEEELDDRDGFRWSSDSKEIAYWQSNTKGVGTFYLINNVDSNYSKPIPLPYPKVGTANSAVKLGVVSANGGKTRWLNLPGDPRNNYIARMDYVPGKNELIIQQLNRLQNTNRVWIANTNSLALTNIYTDTDEAFLNIHDNIVWLENSNAFTWTSEKDGWLHLYKISKDGKTVSLITKGNFDVVNINYIDTANGYVYYIASPENYLQRYLYRSKLDGTGNAERVTPANLAGQNSYQLSGDAKYAIHVFENAQTPKRYSLISLPDHHEIKLLEDNATLKNNIAALGLRPKEFFKVDIGEVVFDAWVIKPINFDPQKKYP
ncbi:MAG: DPP IV N-terminal domain-containing protein, partial [Bacteroidetes bacterium]|nr:DPP IV N-terminal domain-containing protein [Bacteroidota bacterium]